MTPEQEHALEVARRLVAAGVPVFAAPPDPSTSTGFRLPIAWETQRPQVEQVDRWQPGWALCAVMGHRLDLLDVDPRNGGDVARSGLVSAGMWPTVYAAAATPSGGTHDFIAPLGVGSRDAVRDGLDVKGGMPDGSGRGFAFIAPTVKASKLTGGAGRLPLDRRARRDARRRRRHRRGAGRDGAAGQGETAARARRAR